MSSLKNKKILITCGPTWIPIDDMRIISNRSTGEMGHLLTLAFEKAQAKVTLVQGPINRSLESIKTKVIDFCFFDDFSKIIKTELNKEYDVIIHAAAVSDYKLKKPFKSKIKSTTKNLKLELVPTEKIINKIKKISPKSFLVGFKLESKITNKLAIKNTKKLFKEAMCDLVIANRNKSTYKGLLLNNENVLYTATSKKSIVNSLVKTINRELK